MEGYTRNLTQYLGSQHSAVGLLLSFLGAAALLAFGVAAVQIGLTDERNDLGPIIWSVPAWSVIAVPLGLLLRRNRSTGWLWIGAFWLAIPFATFFTLRFEGMLNG